MEEYIVRLTEEQIKLIRKLVSEKASLARRHPLPEDGDLVQRLYAIDVILHSVSQSFP